MSEFRSSPEVVDYTNKLFDQAKATSELWNAEGQDAWSALAKLRNNKLPAGDEVILARNIYEEYPKVKERLRDQGIGIGVFCERAQLSAPGSSSKELGRLMLASEMEPKPGHLRRQARKYRLLLAEMANVLGEDRAQLANRVMRGTSLHPDRTMIRRRLDQLQAILDEIVLRVDREFGLFAMFKKTAELKAEHVKKRGQCRWPQGDADWLQENAGLAQDPKFAYWISTPTKQSIKYYASGWESGCWIEDDFFHIPHVYLGYAEGLFFDNNYLHVDVFADEQSRYAEVTPEKLAEALESLKKDCLEYQKPTVDEWDEELECPRGQVSRPPSSVSIYASERWHAWLIIYPSPDGSRLIPMLFVPAEEGGPCMFPLDRVVLDTLKGNYWVDPDGTVEPFLDRFERMLGYRDDSEDLILKGLRRTAPWFAKNPFMKMQAEEERDLAKMQAYYKKLLSD